MRRLITIYVTLSLVMTMFGVFLLTCQKVSAGADGNERGYAIGYYTQSPTDYLFTAGSTTSYGAGSDDFLVTKYTVDGTQGWYRTWGTSLSDIATCLCMDSNDVYVGGYSQNNNGHDYDAKLISIKPSDGSLNWAAPLKDGGYQTNDLITAICQPYNIFLTGYTISNRGDTDILLYCYDTNGNFKWQTTWDSANHGNDIAYSICGINNDVYIVGSTTDNNNNKDWLLLKCDTNNGAVVQGFPKTWGGAGADYATSVIIDYDDPGYNDHILVGGVYQLNGNDEVAINKYALDGTRIITAPWPIIYGVAGKQYTAKGIATSEYVGPQDLAKVYAVGNTDNGPQSGTNDAFVLIFDKTTGQLSDTRYWYGVNTGSMDYATSICQDSVSKPNIFVMGRTDGISSGGLDEFVFEINYYSQQGSSPDWTQTFGESYSDIPKAIARDGGGNIYTTGSTNSYSSNSYNSFMPATPVKSTVFITKYDSTGTFVWKTTWSPSNLYDCCGNAIAISGTSGYVAGYGKNSNGVCNMLILKFDTTSGNIDPCSRYEVRSYDEIARGITIYRADNPSLAKIYVTGYSKVFSQGVNKDVLINQYGMGLGNPTTSYWPCLGNDNDAYAIDWATSAGTDYLYIVGETKSFGNGGLNIFLERFNLDGSLNWNSPKTLGGDGDDGGHALFIDKTNNMVYVTGYTWKDGSTQGLIEKYNLVGQVQWTFPIYWSYNFKTIPNSITLMNNKIYIAGQQFAQGESGSTGYVKYWDASTYLYQSGINFGDGSEKTNAATSICNDGTYIFISVQCWSGQKTYSGSYDSWTRSYDGTLLNNWYMAWG